MKNALALIGVGAAAVVVYAAAMATFYFLHRIFWPALLAAFGVGA